MNPGNEIAGNEDMRRAAARALPFAGAVFFRRRLVTLRPAWLAVLEIVPKGEGYLVTLTDHDGQELFSYSGSALRVTPAGLMSLRVQYGEERWWLWGMTSLSRTGLERRRRRIGRDDVNLVPPPLPEMDERAYRRVMSNVRAQRAVWRIWWLAVLRLAGAHVE